MSSNDPHETAQKLLDEGWHANLAIGSVTKGADQRSGLVEHAVWLAMKALQAERAWPPTDPLPLPPPGSLQ